METIQNQGKKSLPLLLKGAWLTSAYMAMWTSITIGLHDKGDPGHRFSFWDANSQVIPTFLTHLFVWSN